MSILDLYKNFGNCLQQRYNLTLAESTALQKSIFQNGKEFTRKLLNGDTDADTLEYVTQLIDAISRLPKATVNTVYRNWDFLDCQLERANAFFLENAGNTIKFKTFLSTTKRACFNGNSSSYSLTNKIIVAQSSIAADIESIAVKCGLRSPEQEVLYPINSCFTVRQSTDGTFELIETSSISGAVEVPIF